MSLPPPQLPPPESNQRHEPGRPTTSNAASSWRRLPIGVQLIAIIAACAAVVIGGAVLRSQAKTSKAPAWSYRTETGICDADGYSVVVVNTGDVDMVGKMWATASSGGAVVGRDEEIIRRLGPGERMTIRFVWVLDAEPDRCSIEDFEQY